VFLVAADVAVLWGSESEFQCEPGCFFGQEYSLHCAEDRSIKHSRLVDDGLLANRMSAKEKSGQENVTSILGKVDDESLARATENIVLVWYGVLDACRKWLVRFELVEIEGFTRQCVYWQHVDLFVPLDEQSNSISRDLPNGEQIRCECGRWIAARDLKTESNVR